MIPGAVTCLIFVGLIFNIEINMSHGASINFFLQIPISNASYPNFKINISMLSNFQWLTFVYLFTTQPSFSFLPGDYPTNYTAVLYIISCNLCMRQFQWANYKWEEKEKKRKEKKKKEEEEEDDVKSHFFNNYWETTNISMQLLRLLHYGSIGGTIFKYRGIYFINRIWMYWMWIFVNLSKIITKITEKTTPE